MRVDFTNVGVWWVLVAAVLGFVFWWILPTAKSADRASPAPKAPNDDDEKKGDAP